MIKKFTHNIKPKYLNILVWLAIFIISFIIAWVGAAEAIKGYNAACQNSSDLKNQHFDSTFYQQLAFAIIIPFFLVPIYFLFGLFFGKIHYNLFLKPILTFPNFRNFLLYILVNYLIYDLILIDFFLVKIVKMESGKATEIGFFIWVTSLISALIIYYQMSQNEKILILKQKSEAELQALKNQINPHFLFNSLNNINGLALVEKAPQTAMLVNQMAGIYRHIVEDSKKEFTPIEDELKFITNYFDLQSVRVHNHDGLSLKIDYDEQTFNIAPFLMLPLIENALKFGINNNSPFNVFIDIHIQNKKLVLKTKNSIFDLNDIKVGTKTGILNLKKRLEMLYPIKYELNFIQNIESFEAILKINLN